MIFSIFSQTVHTIRTKASQKEKDLSRLLYRIWGSGLKSSLLQNIKTIEGGLFRDKKFRSRTMPEKNQRGPIVSSGFVSYVENEVNEKGPFAPT